MPLVSIVMAAYNCSSVVDTAVASVRRQTFDAWELLIVDDCSSDATVEIVSKYAKEDSRIRLLKCRRNSGPSAARNIGIDAASGDWIGILDSDDAFAEGRLKSLTDVIRNEKADFVADGLMLVDVGSPLQHMAFPLHDGVRHISLRDLICSDMHKGYSYGFLKPLIRRDFLKSHNLCYDENLRFAEDFKLYAEMLALGANALFVSDPSYLYTTQVGLASRIKSPHTATKFRPIVRVSTVDELLTKYGERLSPINVSLLKQYRKVSLRYARAHEISEYKNQRDFKKLIASAIRHPGAGLRFMIAQRPIRNWFGTGL